MTNTIRHAEGDTLYVSVKGDTCIFTNNGKSPVAEIKERGGLANLRRFAADAGWSVTLESLPEFKLTLRREEKSDV
jgi:signal transduction histidine kinase